MFRHHRAVAADVLSDRALNRATLERQLLLQRSTMAPLDAVEHLIGLQAQNPLDPYLALWSRLEDFDPHHVGRLVEDGRWCGSWSCAARFTSSPPTMPCC